MSILSRINFKLKKMSKKHRGHRKQKTLQCHISPWHCIKLLLRSYQAYQIPNTWSHVTSSVVQCKILKLLLQAGDFPAPDTVAPFVPQIHHLVLADYGTFTRDALKCISNTSSATSHRDSSQMTAQDSNIASHLKHLKIDIPSGALQFCARWHQSNDYFFS